MTDRKELEKLFPPIKRERGGGASDARLAYMVEFQKWLAEEPPMHYIIRWRRWKRRRPTQKEGERA